MLTLTICTLSLMQALAHAAGSASAATSHTESPSGEASQALKQDSARKSPAKASVTLGSCGLGGWFESVLFLCGIVVVVVAVQCATSGMQACV